MQKEILSYLSPARLESYKLPDEPVEKTVERYFWNIRLSETMMPALGLVEIGLRNHINMLICQHYGENWLLHPPKNLRLRQNDLERLRALSSELKQENIVKLNNDSLVTKMNFGFWCSFLQKQYDPILWHQPKAFATVFPNIKKPERTRQQLAPRLHIVRFARNCIAHHEPIWDMQPDIKIIHSTCVDLIYGMSKVVAKKLGLMDRFEDIYEQGSHLLKRSETEHAPKKFDPLRD